MAPTPETIDEYFERYGWQAEFDSTTRTWVTGFCGKSNDFNVLVHLSDDWMYFIVSPFVAAANDDTCQLRLEAYLLRLNHAMNMAKFSIDSDDDAVLTVELPAEGLRYDYFSEGLNALSYYADWYYDDVRRVATDPNFEPDVVDSEGEPWVPLTIDDEKPN